MAKSSMSMIEVAAFVARLKLAGYKVLCFGNDGYCSEVDGMQVFRATAIGNMRFDVKINESIFPDV